MTSVVKPDVSTVLRELLAFVRKTSKNAKNNAVGPHASYRMRVTCGGVPSIDSGRTCFFSVGKHQVTPRQYKSKVKIAKVLPGTMRIVLLSLRFQKSYVASAIEAVHSAMAVWTKSCDIVDGVRPIV